MVNMLIYLYFFNLIDVIFDERDNEIKYSITNSLTKDNDAKLLKSILRQYKYVIIRACCRHC